MDIKYALVLPLAEITWNATDENPLNYTVLHNSSIHLTGPWTGSYIVVNVSEMAHGIHNFTVIVQDLRGKIASDTVILQVVHEFNLPQVSHPHDLEYTYGTTGHLMTWSTYDEHPWRFTIEHNGTQLAGGDWIENVIIVGVDEFALGVHNITVILYDVDWNTNIDTVPVNVTAVALPISSEPDDIETEEGQPGPIT